MEGIHGREIFHLRMFHVHRADAKHRWLADGVAGARRRLDVMNNPFYNGAMSRSDVDQAKAFESAIEYLPDFFSEQIPGALIDAVYDACHTAASHYIGVSPRTLRESITEQKAEDALLAWLQKRIEGRLK